MYAVFDHAFGDAKLGSQRVAHIGIGGEELVQRWVEQANGHRPTGHGLEQAGEVLALERQQLGERGAAFAVVGGEDHPPHVLDPVVLEEHVLGAAQPDALGAVVEGVLGHGRRVGVGAYLYVPETVRPRHDGLVKLVPVALHWVHAAGEHLADFRRRSRDFAGVDRTGRTVQRNRVPLP